MAKRAKPAAKRGAGRIETSQGRRRRIADAARFRPLRRRAASPRPSWCSRMAPPIRLPRPPSWSARRCICTPTSSRRSPPRASRRPKAEKILDLIARRVTTRKPAAYLVNKIYMRGLPFYVDERTIVPRSFIGELLDQHFGGEQDDDEEDGSLIGDPASVRKRARPLHRLGLPCHSGEPEFSECRNRRGGYFKGCARGRRAQCRRLRAGGSLDAVPRRSVQAAGRQALRPDHFQSALCRCGRHGRPAARMPRRAEARLRRRRRRARYCQAHPRRGDRAPDAAGRAVMRDRPLPSAARGRLSATLPLLWLDTEDSEGEVFWIAAADL